MQDVIVQLGKALSDDLPDQEHMVKVAPAQPAPVAAPAATTTYTSPEGTAQAEITHPVPPVMPQDEQAQVIMTEDERIQYEAEEAKND
ncbi:hypothetical protein D3C76_713600 [compost metagenome]